MWEDEWIQTGQSGFCDYTLIEVNSCCLCVCVFVCGSNIINDIFLEAFTQQEVTKK